MATLFALIAVLTIPLGLDRYMPVPEDNPITAEKIAQGRAITPSVSGRRGTRHPPALINRGWGRSFFWDGRAETLEEQVRTSRRPAR